MAAALLIKGIAPGDLARELLRLLGEPDLDRGSRPAEPEAEAALATAIAQLEHQNKELQRSNAELETFASVASHDLAQPLQIAYGYLQMLRDDYAASLDPTAAKWLDASIASLERMRSLVHDILSYARTGNAAFPRVPVDLSVVVNDAVEMCRPLIESRNAGIEVADLPMVEGDAVQLTQLFQNVITNAVKFVPADRRPEVRITSAPNTDEGGVVITVADNGNGVRESAREKVFEMFHREDKTISGTGLGLAICRKLVARHDGRMWIDTSPLGGAAVHIFLPR
jgi:signal transduction histidine kinase